MNRNRLQNILPITLVLAFAVLLIWLWPSLTAPNRSPEELARDFDIALAEKRLDDARRAMIQFEKKVEATDPRLPMFHARMHMANGKEAESLAELKSIPDSSSFAPMARLLEGQLHLRAGRLVPAEKAYLESIRLDPKIVQARRELIYIYGIQLRRRELRQVFNDLSKIAPLTFQNVFHWCLTRGNDWEPDEIVADMTKFLAADPTDRWSRIALARSLRRLTKFEETQKALEPLPEADPDALAIRVELALDRNQPDKARALLATGPENQFELSILRAQLALADGDFKAAEAQFEIALRIDPGNRDAVVGMARALAASGDREKARTWQEKASRLDKLASLIQEAAKPNGPLDPTLPKRLAEGCESVGHLAEAKAWWGLIAARDPLNPEAQQALYRLEKSITQAP